MDKLNFVKVSVIIPCYNEELYISACLESLLSGSFPDENLEILVVDGGSTDKTRDLVFQLQEKYPQQILWIENPRQKTPFALNLGIQKASHPLILIAGAHAVYPADYLNRLLEIIQEPGIDVVGGAIETRVKNRNPKTRAIQFVLSHRFGVGNSLFRIGADSLIEVDTVPFGLYKKAVFEKAGEYNERLIRNHDMELSKRIKAAGFHIWMEPALRVTYFARETFSGLAKNNFGNGFWNIRTLFITRKFKSLGLRHYIPVLFLFSLILPLFLALFIDGRFMLISLASLVLYLVFITGIGIQHLKSIKLYYLLQAFFVLHFSYGWGSLMGFLPECGNKRKPKENKFQNSLR
ncbi:MAG: glycosyltransferase family 2 protein [Salinivirgaceae bacterium]